MTEKERFDAVQSALTGLSVRDARDFLYQFMEKRLDATPVASPDASSAADAALMQMASALGAN